jgi:hypothetical protein
MAAGGLPAGCLTGSGEKLTPRGFCAFSRKILKIFLCRVGATIHLMDYINKGLFKNQ